MTFREFLSNFNFDYRVDDNKIALIDLQGVNLGNIESERFTSIEDVVNRLHNYINDDQVDGIDYELECCGVDEDDIAILSLQDKITLAETIGAEVYDYYRAVINPSLIELQ